MLHFLANYGLFLAKAITLVAAILITVAGIIALSFREKGKHKEKIDVKKINTIFKEMGDTLYQAVSNKSAYKKYLKEQKQAEKALKKDTTEKKRIFVINFIGDMRASAVNALREEITAILIIAKPTDEVVVVLESGGGMVPNYGLGASQLERIKQKHIPLTVIVDKVAASGGYLMACVANQVLAAPFAYIGSIGVIAQLPNFHRLLKRNDIDFEQVTAGEFKRTLTMFGENTEKARKKLQDDVEEIHQLFKNFISQHRPQVNLSEVATGEYWLALRAKELNLVDDLKTSDDYLLAASKTRDIYLVTYSIKKSLAEKLGFGISKMYARLIRSSTETLTHF